MAPSALPLASGSTPPSSTTPTPLSSDLSSTAKTMSTASATHTSSGKAPARAVGPFGPRETVASRKCGSFQGVATATSTVGFAGCEDGLRYAERQANARWQLELSPYRGTVLDVAGDDTNVFVLFREGAAGHPMLGKRSGGRFLPATELGKQAAGDVATLVAVRGTWRAVWSEGTTDDSGTGAVLYEAGSNFDRRAVVTPDGTFDTHPCLAVVPSAGALRLVYNATGPDGRLHSLQYATAGTLFEPFATPRTLRRGSSPFKPQIASAASADYVAFLNGVIPTVAELTEPQGSIRSKDFYTEEGASDVRVAVSSGIPVVGWTAPRGGAGDGSNIDIADRRSGNWTVQRFAQPAPYVYEVLLELMSVKGRAIGVAFGESLISRRQ
jgi:hypothetical protein